MQKNQHATGLRKIFEMKIFTKPPDLIFFLKISLYAPGLEKIFDFNFFFTMPLDLEFF